MINFEKEIRKLARSDYWQSVYSANKESANIQLFTNNSCLSGTQLLFLEWLQTYYTLYLDLARQESMFLTEKVINDDLRCNAYLYMRRQKAKQEWFKHQQEKRESDTKSKHKFKHQGKVQTIDVDLRTE